MSEGLQKTIRYNREMCLSISAIDLMVFGTPGYIYEYPVDSYRVSHVYFFKVPVGFDLVKATVVYQQKLLSHI